MALLNTKLVDLLTEQTQSLKEQYVQSCIEWATARYENLVIRSKWKEVDWCEYYGLEPRLVNAGTEREFKSFPEGFYNTRLSRRYDKDWTECRKVAKTDKTEYIKQTERNAIDHYTFSIEKLAYRISQKGLDESNIELHTSHVGVNIETTITDGNKTVRAWTIIASGQVQQPHYRYLIK